MTDSDKFAQQVRDKAWDIKCAERAVIAAAKEYVRLWERHADYSLVEFHRKELLEAVRRLEEIENR